MKEVLIITSYYPPEIGAASNRIFHLAQGLQERDFDVSVITPLPNYPTGKIFQEYRGKFRKTYIENKVKIHRLWIYASNSRNKFKRLLAMLSYSFSLMWFIITHKIPKTVIVQSPPLLVAFTCMLFLRKNRQLILNVSDLWPSAGLELGAFKKNLSYRILERLERFNYKKATLVLGQSNEILNHILRIVPDKKTLLYRNFPQFELPAILKENSSSNKLRIVYAGLLGVAQGIFELCQKLDYSNIELHLYGSGSECAKILEFISLNPELPIFYHGELKREDLHGELLKFDITIIPLVKRIYGSVPSKIYEYTRLGLPILYFGGGEGEDIIKEFQLGWVAENRNYKALNEVLSEIRDSDLTKDLRLRIQEVAEKEFDFSSQLNHLSQHL